MMDPITIAAYMFGLVMLYLLGRVLLIPLRFLVQVALHALVGGLALAVLNGLTRYWETVDLYVPINPVTALVTGFLGLPGVVVLWVLRHWLVAPLWGGGASPPLP